MVEFFGGAACATDFTGVYEDRDGDAIIIWHRDKDTLQIFSGCKPSWEIATGHILTSRSRIPFKSRSAFSRKVIDVTFCIGDQVAVHRLIPKAFGNLKIEAVDNEWKLRPNSRDKARQAQAMLALVYPTEEQLRSLGNDFPADKKASLEALKKKVQVQVQAVKEEVGKSKPNTRSFQKELQDGQKLLEKEATALKSAKAKLVAEARSLVDQCEGQLLKMDDNVSADMKQVQELKASIDTEARFDVLEKRTIDLEELLKKMKMTVNIPAPTLQRLEPAKPPEPSQSPDSSVQDQIRQARDFIDDTGTILFSHIIMPVLAHGSHLIYAPDEVACHIASKVIGGVRGLPEGVTKFFTKRSKSRIMPKDVMKFLEKNWPVLTSLIIGLYIFHGYAQILKCAMQNTFMAWAAWNREVGPAVRVISISALMVVRLLVSNALPFTSPAFAYIIAKSQPEGEEGAGALYLLLCSMPAGALMPFLDWLAEHRYGEKFLATKYASLVTDYLPFSFWVRPLFMEPAFLAVRTAGLDLPGQAAAAVLAGHFMIWAGPATTMHQRKFVPDLITCVFIQPLGLMEDIAVILATWAGGTVQSQKQAQIAMYVFMLLMNLIQYYSTAALVDVKLLAVAVKRHSLVAALTVMCIVVKYLVPVGANSEVSTTTIAPTSTTSVTPLCATEHSNVSAVASTVLQVSAEAVIFSLLAKCLFTGGAAPRPQDDDSAKPLLP